MTMISRYLVSALFLIAACAGAPWASAQNSYINKVSITSVVTTDQVRAELLAWAPDGVEPGKRRSHQQIEK